MTQEKLQTMYGSTPDRFERRVAYALQQIQSRPCKKSRAFRTALVIALVLVLLTAIAYAAFSSQVIEFFSRASDRDIRKWLEQGEVAVPDRSFVLNGVVYTVDEVIYRDNALYGVGTIRPEKGENMLLIPEDHSPDEPFGYDVYGEGGIAETAPADAPTIADTLRQTGGKLLVVRTIPNRIGVDGGTMLAPDSVGYTNAPQRDGSIRFSFEVSDAYAIEKGTLYTIEMLASTREMTSDGTVLEDTRHRETWTVEIEPSPMNTQP